MYKIFLKMEEHYGIPEKREEIKRIKKKTSLEREVILHTVKNLDYDDLCDWLDGISMSDIEYVLKHLSRGDSYESIKWYYYNKLSKETNNLVNAESYFTWFPVKLENGGWTWLTKVIRVVDERDEKYLGLLPIVKYYKC